MATPHSQFTDRRWRCSALVGLLIALTAWTSAWPLKPLRGRMPVTVHEGQLSVDLREASVREVLAAIGQQAGLRVHVDAAGHRTVNAQFTNVALDQGLRRLLRAASLSYTLLYVPGPAATAILHEVRVFGEAHSAAPASHDRALLDRVHRAAARRSSLPSEAQAGPAQEAEPEPDAEPELAELEPDGDATQD
jgi:type II secretory pathway component GspD/PulD (secretin)